MTLTNTQLLLSQATERLSKQTEQRMFKDLRQFKIDVESWENTPKRTLNENSQLHAAKIRVKVVKTRLVQANLPLVVKVAKYFVCPGVDEEQLVSEGLVKLLQCIDAFKVDYGFKFSTYLQRPLFRHFTRYIAKETKRNWGRIDGEMAFKTEVAEDSTSPEADELLEVLNQNTADLDAMEKTIIIHAYGIGRQGPMTLKQLRVEFGLSTARLKAILARTKDKLRTALMEETNEIE